MLELRAASNLRGHRIDLAWTWREAGARPGLRLVRQGRRYPSGPHDGTVVVDFDELFPTPAAPWGRIARLRCLADRSGSGEPLVQAELVLCFAGEDDPSPALVRLRMHDDGTGTPFEIEVDEVGSLGVGTGGTARWPSIEEIDVRGPSDTAVGTLVLSLGDPAEEPPGRISWVTAGVPGAVEAAFDQLEATVTLMRTEHPLVEVTLTEWETRLLPTTTSVTALLLPPDGLEGTEPRWHAVLEETPDQDAGVHVRSFRVADAARPPLVPQYYVAFVPDAGSPSGFVTEREWRTVEAATARYGFGEQLYGALPGVHVRYDEPTAAMRGRGQLRRYLELAGGGLDGLRSLADGLQTRHDVQRVRGDFLPWMARWIGWEPDLTAPLDAQRRDIGFAPEIFERVGTLPNLRALVNRATGWECRIKEFVHNVCLTNAPEEVHGWDFLERRWVGAGDGSAPAPALLSEGFEGTPALVVAGGARWIFWHSDRSGRRELWAQRQDGLDPAPRRVMLDTVDDAAELDFHDEDPAPLAEGAAVRLFWSSNREGQWDLWERTLDGFPAGPPHRLTDHLADDRNPATVRDGAGRTWLFWESNRRGPTDIWARVEDGVWGLPFRLTTAVRHDAMPAAALDGAGRLWLFWSADEGDRRLIRYQVLEGDDWSEPEIAVEQLDGPYRDEAPAAAFHDGRLRLFWHSNRSGGWDIWSRDHTGGAMDDPTTWTDPVRLTDPPEADAGAAVVEEGGTLHLAWRSQHRAPLHRSRTLDTADAAALSRLGTFEDRAHYTYDTATRNEDHFARDTVGVYLDAESGTPERIERVIARARDFVDPFRPVQVRYVWIPVVHAHEDAIPTDAVTAEEWEDEIT
ncbi:MAG: hypothetical protein EA350_03825 [Gemmatimonadales bacterium]|nr:MAG: hypothetical protein EA350_03825 [Gemmatimonadales bacterium]